MTTPLRYDSRYRVNQKKVDKMRILRKMGLPYQKIAKRLKVSSFTAYYWINKDYQKAKRKINSNRKYILNTLENKKRIIHAVKRRRSLSHLAPIRFQLRKSSALNEYRCKRHTVMGIPLKQYIEDGNRKYQRGNIKIK